MPEKTFFQILDEEIRKRGYAIKVIPISDQKKHGD